MEKNKNEKPLNLDMDFEEAMQRLTNVPKSQVEANIKRERRKTTMASFKIPKLNVPVGIYLISLLAIAAGEHYNLCFTFWAGMVSGAVSLGTIIWVIPAYVRN